MALKHFLEGKRTIPHSVHNFNELKAKLILQHKNYTNPVCLKLGTKNKRGEQAHMQPSYEQTMSITENLNSQAGTEVTGAEA